MITEEEALQSSAQQLVQEHGDAAEDYALNRMQQCMDDENVIQASVWLAIAQAVCKIQTDQLKVIH